MRYLFVVLLLLGGCGERKNVIGRFQMVSTHGSNFQEERVWVLDTTNGKLTLCYYQTHLGCVGQIPALADLEKK